MSPRFVLGRENVPCVAEVVNRSLKADCTDLAVTTYFGSRYYLPKKKDPNRLKKYLAFWAQLLRHKHKKFSTKTSVYGSYVC